MFRSKDRQSHLQQRWPQPQLQQFGLASDHIYQFGKNDVMIYKTGKKYDEVARFKHGFEDFIASAVFDGPRFYLRDKHGLHCIGR